MANRVARLAGNDPTLPRWRRIDLTRSFGLGSYKEIEALERVGLLGHGTRIKRSWYWSDQQVQECLARLKVGGGDAHAAQGLITAQQIIEQGIFANLDELAFSVRWLRFPSPVTARPRRWASNAVQGWVEARHAGADTSPPTGQADSDLQATVQKLSADVTHLGQRLDALIASMMPAGAGSAG